MVVVQTGRRLESNAPRKRMPRNTEGIMITVFNFRPRAAYKNVQFKEGGWGGGCNAPWW